MRCGIIQFLRAFLHSLDPKLPVTPGSYQATKLIDRTGCYYEKEAARADGTRSVLPIGNIYRKACLPAQWITGR